jgi:hypothetical protein
LQADGGLTVARVQASIAIDKSTWDAADKLLAKIEASVRGKTVDQGLRKIGNQIKSQTRSILPKPGYPGDKPGLKPLRETLKVKVVNYKGGVVKVMIVGYTYSRTPGVGGNHGHLLEGGHKKVLWGRRTEEMVQPYEYMIQVVENNKPQHQANLLITIQKAVKV